MKDFVKSLGANEKEARSFLVLLELGAQPISVIAKQMGVPRSSMYLIVEKLKELSLVEELERDGIKYVQCIPVKNLEDVLMARERDIQQKMSVLREKLPEFNELEKRLSITPKVKYFEGKKNVMNMYENIMKEEDFYAFFNPSLVKSMMPEYHYLLPKTIKKHGREVREILVDSPEAREYKKEFESKKHQIRILPKTSTFQTDTIICMSKIYMVAYGTNEVSAVEIHNPTLAQSQRVIFELVWENLD